MNAQFDYAIVDKIVEAHDCKQSGIIAILQEIQEHYLLELHFWLEE